MGKAQGRRGLTGWGCVQHGRFLLALPESVSVLERVREQGLSLQPNGMMIQHVDSSTGEERTTYRTIDAKAEALVPETEVNTWWTSLKLRANVVIELHHAHSTSGQYHAEIKPDMDLERLPSGHYATSALVLSLGMVAYRVLRSIGQQALQEQERCTVAKGRRCRRGFSAADLTEWRWRVFALSRLPPARNHAVGGVAAKTATFHVLWLPSNIQDHVAPARKTAVPTRGTTAEASWGNSEAVAPARATASPDSAGRMSKFSRSITTKGGECSK